MYSVNNNKTNDDNPNTSCRFKTNVTIFDGPEMATQKISEDVDHEFIMNKSKISKDTHIEEIKNNLSLVDAPNTINQNNSIQRFCNRNTPLDNSIKVPQDKNSTQQLQLLQQRLIDDRHLIKTIADLPIFVTIERYRVASYSIAGEPHICLPQLLQHLKLDFPLERVVAEFEDADINFINATPKQVEGFVKTSILPSSAKTCTLIKRSDADKICLKLFDDYSNNPLNNIIYLCSKPAESKDQNGISNQTAEDKKHNENKNTSQDEPERLTHDLDKDSRNYLKCVSNDEKYSSPGQVNVSINLATESSLGDKNHEYIKGWCHKTADVQNSVTNLNMSSYIPNSTKPMARYQDRVNMPVRLTDRVLCITKKGPLFEVEAQNSILDLAKSVTSTLMIHVYHRCFGKSTGLYYPSLLKDSESKCIECTNCHMMLNPRRFIGHTHGSRESNVCHWGFNSFLWRNYVRLSKKQPMNNLDDDELLVQFNLLLKIPDSDDELNNGYRNVELPSICMGSVQEAYRLETNQPEDRESIERNHDLSFACLSAGGTDSRAALSKAFNMNQMSNPLANRIYSPSLIATSLNENSAIFNGYLGLTMGNSQDMNTQLIKRNFSKRGIPPNSVEMFDSIKKTRFSTDDRVVSGNYPGAQNTSSLESNEKCTDLVDILDSSNITDTHLLSARGRYPYVANNFIKQRVSHSSDTGAIGTNINKTEIANHYNNSFNTKNDSRRELYIRENLAVYLEGRGFSQRVAGEIIEDTLSIVCSSDRLF